MNILICEDERLIALDLHNSLIKMGHNVADICHTGTELIDQVKRIIPELIITDISLRGDINGIEAIKVIQLWRKIPFMYLTGLKDDSTYRVAMETNPCAFISKPFNYFELKNHIEKCISTLYQVNKIQV